MKKTRLSKPPVHPGEILLDGYMRERGITVGEMSTALGISRNQMSCIVNGRKPLSTKVAVKLARVTGTSAILWLNLQNKFDVWHVERKLTENNSALLKKYQKKFAEKVAV